MYDKLFQIISIHIVGFFAEKKRIMFLISFVQLVSFLFCCNVFAQAVHPSDIKNSTVHRIYADTGLDYGTVAGTGYQYKFSLDSARVLTGAEFAAPAGRDVLDDYRISVPVQVWLFPVDSFAIAVHANQMFRTTENWAYNHVNFGTEAGILSSYYRDFWFAGAELSYDKAWLTHIQHSNEYLKEYPDAKSGWYSATGGNIKLGMQVGVTFGNIGVTLCGGIVENENLFDDYSNSLPAYMLLGSYCCF
jgi:hypothetical protein